MAGNAEHAPHKQQSTPAPLETEPGTQQDDNLDDLGRRPDGTEQDQPVTPQKPDRDKSRQR